MTSHAAVGVDNDFATGEPGVANRTADDESASRIHEYLVVVIGELRGDDWSNDVFDEVRANCVFAIDAFIVLR